MTRIDTLVQQLTVARDAYYNGSPVMTDAQFDALEDELRALDPASAFFSKVGAPAPVGGAWPKAKHSTPMGSLNKAQEAADLTGWFQTCRPTSGLLLSEKLDGLSLNLRYEKQRLVQALTRGDGETGENITRNALLVQGVLKVLPLTLPDGSPTPNVLFIRGEVICTLSNFKAYFPEDSNPRNTAAGTLKRQTDADDCCHLTFKAYQYLPEGRATLPSKETEFRALEAAGFMAPNWYVCTSLTEVERHYTDYVAKTRALLDYDIDGLVVEVDGTAEREALGEHANRPKGAVAYKFPHEEQESPLRNVRWQVGNSGRITPVAEFDPVTLVGAQVKQASLHNLSNIQRLLDESPLVTTQIPRPTALYEGIRLLVARRGDVIPYVEAIVGDSTLPAVQIFLPPTLCPSCGSPLQRDGEYLVCRNEECPAQTAGSIKRWVKKIGVLHVGDALIEALIEAGLVVDIADLYTLDSAAAYSVGVGGRKAGGTADKAIKNLTAKKSLPLHTFVGALGIPMIGRTMAKTIVDGGFNTLSKMYKARIPEIAAIPGVGDVKATAFVEGFAARAGLIAKLLGEADIKIQVSTGPLVGQSFCMTGFRDPDLGAAIEKAGGTMKDSVSKGLTFLIALDPNSTSGKAQKAKAYSTRVIGVDEARKLAGL